MPSPLRILLAGALATALTLTALAQPPATRTAAPATAGRTFAVGDPGRTFASSTVHSGVIAIQFMPELGSVRCRSTIQEYTAGAPTLAGVKIIFVSAEPADAFKIALAALPAGSLPAYRDGDGHLAAEFKVAPASSTLIILDSSGRELFRQAAKSPSDHLSFSVFAAKFGELTRDKETAEANLDSSHLALQGYDPIAYLDEHKAVPGDKKIESAFRGITYRFTSASNREKFNADPPKYLPAYGGWCATAMAKNDKVEIDPKNFKVTGGRVFLFYKGLFGNALNDWNKDEPGLTAKADANWQKLAPGSAPGR